MGFALARDGHIRSAYSVAPAVLAWLPSEVLAATGLVPARRANAAVYAKAGASLLVTLAVVFAFFAARWRTNSTWAALIALGFGLGTNAWPTASQALWQHESALAGLALAVLCAGACHGQFEDVAIVAGCHRSGNSLAPHVTRLLPLSSFWRRA